MSTGTLNKVMVIGHTGDDIKMHYFEGGGCIGRVPLATNESYTNKTTGEKVTNTEWHNLVFRNKAAEICEKYLKKGDKLYAEGRIKTRKWQDDQGQDRYSTEIDVREFTFLTPKGESSQAPQGNNGRQGSAVDKYNAEAAAKKGHAGDQFLAGNTQPPEEEEDDLPF